MSIDIPNFIKDKLRKAGSTIDTRPGSVWNDLVGNPLKHILEDFVSFQDEVLKNQSLLNSDVMDDGTLDLMAENFLVTRQLGGYATGGITLYFNTAQSITVPAGSIFATAEGLEYSTITNYTTSSQAMALNRDKYPLFNTEEIPVRSRAAGDVYNVNSDKIVQNVTWGGTATQISNTNPLVGGQAREDNENLVERIRDSVHGPNMSSVTGIKKMLNGFYPSLEDISIVGTNNPLMQRDLSLLTSAVESYQEEDFYMIYSGMSGPLSKPHRAYWGNFVDLDETASIALPRPDQFAFEFSDPMYEGLFFRDDMYTSDTNYTTIVQEYFDWVNVSGEVIAKPIEVVLASGMWELHDGQSPMIGADNLRGKPYNDEFAVAPAGYLRLGKAYDITADDFEMQIPYSTMLSLQELLVTTVDTEAITTGTEDVDGSADTDE